jgi:hypothetical protein
MHAGCERFKKRSTGVRKLRISRSRLFLQFSRRKRPDSHRSTRGKKTAEAKSLLLRANVSARHDPDSWVALGESEKDLGEYPAAISQLKQGALALIHSSAMPWWPYSCAMKNRRRGKRAGNVISHRSPGRTDALWVASLFALKLDIARFRLIGEFPHRMMGLPPAQAPVTNGPTPSASDIAVEPQPWLGTLALICTLSGGPLGTARERSLTINQRLGPR